MFIALLIVGAVSATMGAGAETKPSRYILDGQGRQIIPGGFVVLEKIHYTPDDYKRMIRMGANFQVIRMPIGQIGGWPGMASDPGALKMFDDMVRMGRDAGLRTMLKLVVYGQRFNQKDWDALWRNTNGSQDAVMAGWTRIWIRYKDEPSVFGYDLLNEPQRGTDPDYDRCQRESMLPFLRRLTDAMHKISPEKYALYQPLLRKPEDQWAPGKNPVVAIEEPFGRERVIYAPHLYQMDPTVIGPMLDDFQRQAAISNVPVLLGEWGSPTRETTENNPVEQKRYNKIYKLTVNELDARSIGGIKAWFCGARKPIAVPGSSNWMTWAIFTDRTSAGHVEREYITDVLARPRPLMVAGRLERYGNNFATLHFEMVLKTDPILGATEIFVPADRHYARGFCIELGPDLTLALVPEAEGLGTVRAVKSVDQQQASHVRWDSDQQRLTIEKWVGKSEILTVKIYPLTAALRHSGR